MNSTPPKHKAALVAGAVGWWLLLLLLPAAPAAPADEPAVGVLLSREIAPYVEMVEGLENRLPLRVDRFFFDDRGRPYSLVGRELTGPATTYRALVAVGPEALDHLATRAGEVPLVHAMVLNPERLLTPGGRRCGVSLNLPVAGQFGAIQRHLPGLRRLGVLFDPANNQPWFDRASSVAAARGFSLVPIRVRQVAGRLEMTGDLRHLQALLFIPDQSIISRSVIEYVIRQGVYRRLPVIGYNRFFLDSGAAMSFLVDYREVGRQTARQVTALLADEYCPPVLPPAFQVKVNPEVWRALDLPPVGDDPGGGGGS